MDHEAQINAYTAWVNSQLKKRSKQIENFSEDLKDGQALIDVVEIVSGQIIGKLDVVNNPENKAKNVLKILDFMQNNGIRLQQVTLEGVLEGNTKVLMRLILALAAHFKPASIGCRRPSFDSNSSVSSYSKIKSPYKWKTTLKSNTLNESSNTSVQKEVFEDVLEVKKMTENLQKILLEEVDPPSIETEENLFEENVTLKARVDQSCIDIEKLKNELSESRKDCRKVRSEFAVLSSRCSKQERELLTLRQKVLRQKLTHDKFETEKAEMVLHIESLQDEVERSKTQLRQKDQELDQSKHEIELLKNDHFRKMSRKDHEINQLKLNLNTSSLISSSEAFNGNSSPRLSPAPRSLNSSRVSLATSPKIIRRSPLSKNHPSRRVKPPEFVETRILYFIDREMTPAIASISKRVGEITLEEFKRVTKKQGPYRFIFKALDPELGTVKEEVFNDADIIPGWEGKIVAWIEEKISV